MIDLQKIDAVTAGYGKAQDLTDKTTSHVSQRLALIDPITRAYSKAFFEVQLEIQWNIALRQQAHLNLFIVEVECFDKFCHDNGQHSGDYALQKLAKCLTLLFRRASDLVFRSDTHQFVILASAMDDAQASLYAEQLRARIKNLKIVNRKTGEHLLANVSCVSQVPKIDIQPQSMIQKALNKLEA